MPLVPFLFSIFSTSSKTSSSPSSLFSSLLFEWSLLKQKKKWDCQKKNKLWIFDRWRCFGHAPQFSHNLHPQWSIASGWPFANVFWQIRNFNRCFVHNVVILNQILCPFWHVDETPMGQKAKNFWKGFIFNKLYFSFSFEYLNCVCWKFVLIVAFCDEPCWFFQADQFSCVKPFKFLSV